jgi:hypothetical protein
VLSRLREFRRQFRELSITERQSLHAVALGVGFCLGLGIGALTRDAIMGAGIGAIACALLFSAVVWLPY